MLSLLSPPPYFVQVIVFNSILGADGVGRIAELKGNSSKLKVGDRVIVMPSIGWIKDPKGPEGDHFIIGGGPAPGRILFFLFITGGKQDPLHHREKLGREENRCSVEHKTER